MVNDGFTSAQAAERALALGYAPEGTRAGLDALLSLDAALGNVVRSTREPMVGQMRLTWWHDALQALDTATPPAEPVLTALAAHVTPVVPGADLAGMIDAWELLLDPFDASHLDAFAARRGGVLFTAMARLVSVDATMASTAGEGWALADLAANLSDAGLAQEARRRASERLSGAFAARWPVRARAIGALALIARADLAPDSAPPAGPRRTARLAWHRLTGR
jgi:phytoene synthase